jgi:hypothetical protein
MLEQDFSSFLKEEYPDRRSGEGGWILTTPSADLRVSVHPSFEKEGKSNLNII